MFKLDFYAALYNPKHTLIVMPISDMNLFDPKIIYITTTLFLTIFAARSQHSSITSINDQIEIIDKISEFEVFSLEHEEFMNRMADHGAELNGHYEHNRLKKIVKKVGEPTADLITEFYFWNDQLVYVNYQQRPYFQKTNNEGQIILDYERSFTKFASKYYYQNEVLIHSVTTGTPLKKYQIDPEQVAYANKMKGLLDNKYYNKDLYHALQGKWLFIENSNDYIIFEGTIRFNFYNKRFANRLKTKISDSIMTCWFPKDENRIHQYKIETLKDGILTLRDIFSNEEFPYAKIE